MAALLALILGAAPTSAAEEVVVPVTLDGTWRWIEWTSRPDLRLRTPASERFERYLILREDDTHEYWGNDSTGTYRITAGRAQVRDMAEVSPSAPRGAFLLQLESWNLQVARLTARDTLLLSPAGEPGTPQPIRRFVRLNEGAYQPPRHPMPRFRTLRLPHGVTYQEVEGQPDFYDTPPVPKFMQPPSYPELAKEAGISGTAVLHLLIGSDGTVHNARVVERLVGLDQAALDAVREATFDPAILDGRPVAAWTAMAFTFTLPP